MPLDDFFESLGAAARAGGGAGMGTASLASSSTPNMRRRAWAPEFRRALRAEVRGDTRGRLLRGPSSGTGSMAEPAEEAVEYERSMFEAPLLGVAGEARLALDAPGRPEESAEMSSRSAREWKVSAPEGHMDVGELVSAEDDPGL